MHLKDTLIKGFVNIQVKWKIRFDCNNECGRMCNYVE